MKYFFSLRTPIPTISRIVFVFAFFANINFSFGTEYTMPLYPEVSDLLFTNRTNGVLLKDWGDFCRLGELELYLSEDINLDSADYKLSVVASRNNIGSRDQSFSFNFVESFTARDTVYYLIGIYSSDCNTDTLSYGTFTRIVTVDEYEYSDIISSNIIAPDTIRNDTQIVIQTESEEIRVFSRWGHYDSSFVYLSTDAILDETDTLLSKVSQYFWNYKSITLVEHNVHINTALTGEYYLIHKVEPQDYTESDSLNNTSFKKIVVVEPGTVYENINSDTITDYTIGNCEPDETIIVKNFNSRCNLNICTRNVFLDSNVLVSIYLSDDAIFDASDKKISDKVYIPDDINSSYSEIYFKIDSSAKAGPAYLIAFVNSDTAIVESNYDNNFFAKKIIITEPMGKLLIDKYIAPKAILSTPLGLKITTYRTNMGKGYAAGIVHDLYLTQNSVLSPSDTLYATLTDNNKCYIGQTKTLELSFSTPDSMAYGEYYLISHIYSTANSEEIDTIITSKIVRRDKAYDLYIDQEPSESPGSYFHLMDGETLSYTLRNNGPDYQSASPSERHSIDLDIYLSDDEVYDSTDIHISNYSPYISSYAVIRPEIDVNFRNLPKGDYYLIAVVSSDYDTIVENNIRIDAIQLLGSRQDFYVSDFALNTGFFYMPGDTIDFSTYLGVKNLNTDYWSHFSIISLSKDDAYSPDDIRLDGYDFIKGSDGAINYSSKVELPDDIADGIYYIGSIINPQNYFCEAIEENNFSYWPIYVGERKSNDVSVHLKDVSSVPNYYPGKNYSVEFNLLANDTIFEIFDLSLTYKKLGSTESPGSLVDDLRWLSWGDTNISASLDFYLPRTVDTGYYEIELSCIPEAGSNDPDLSNNKASYVVHVGDFTVDVSSIQPSQKDKQEIKLYPNPGSGQFILNIPGSNMEYTVQIYSQVGQLMFEEIHFAGQENTINIEDFSNGIYFVKIVFDTNETRIIKLIKE